MGKERKPKHILVTGGCGFIGTNFIRSLFRNRNFRGTVINVDKLSYAGNPENLSDIDRQYGKPWYQYFVGGLGRYRRSETHGPFVHIDVRGSHARWGR